MVAVAVVSPIAAAYGALDAPNDVEPTLRDIILPQRAGLYQIYQAPPGEEPRLRIDFDREGRWVLYLDEVHRNNRHDPGEPALFAARLPQVHGNGTDHARVILPGGVAFTICVEGAADPAADPTAEGARCGGDLDADGQGDFNETASGSDPIAPTGCMDEATSTTSLAESAASAACGTLRPIQAARGGLASFQITPGGGDATAGEPWRVTVRALDDAGAVKSDYAETIVPTSSDAKATADPLVFEGGVASGTVTFRTAGPATLTVCDRAAAPPDGVCTTSGAVDVVPGNLSRIAIENEGDVPALDPVVMASGMIASWHLEGYDAFENKLAEPPAGTWAVETSSGDDCGALEAAVGALNNLTALRATTNASASTASRSPVGCRVVASVGALTATTGPITVHQGALESVVIRDAPDGGGAIVAARALTADERLTLYAAAYDAEGNFIADVTAAWTVLGPCGTLAPAAGTPAVVFDATKATPASANCRVEAITSVVDPVAPSARTDETGALTVRAGAIAAITARDGAGDAGALVSSLVVGNHTHTPLYAAGHDADGNYVSAASVAWAVVAATAPDAPCGTVDVDAPATASSAVFFAGASPTDPNANCRIVLASTAGAVATIPVSVRAITSVEIVDPALVQIAGATEPVVYNATTRAGSTVVRHAPGDIAWSISSPDGGAFDGATLTPTNTSGEYTITAAINGKQGTRSFTIAPATLASFGVSCDPVPATVNASVACGLVDPVDAFGNPVDATPAWTAQDRSGAAIPIAEGAFTAPTTLAEGPVTVRASASGLVESLDVALVSAPLARFTLTCPPRAIVGTQIACTTSAGADAFGNPQEVADPAWSATGASGGALDVEAGSFLLPQLVAEAPVRVVVTSGAASASADIGLLPGALSAFSIACTPSVPTVAQAVECGASDGADSFGNAQDIGPVAWSVADSQGATIASVPGFTTPADASRAPIEVTATAGGIARKLWLGVTADELAAFSLTCPTSVDVGASVACAVSAGRDAHGNARSIGDVAWSVKRADGSALAASSAFAAPVSTSAGPLVVSATSNGVTRVASIGLQPLAPASFSLACGGATVEAGSTLRCVANDARDAHGNPTALGAIAWSAADGTGASLPVVDGQLVAPSDVGIRTVEIRAAIGDVARAANLTLVAAPLADFALACERASVAIGEPVACSVSNGRDAFGNPRDIGSVAWRVTDALGEEVATNDAFRAPGNASRGPLVVVATAQGVSNTTRVALFVPPPPPSVAPIPPVSVAPEMTARFDAPGRALVGQALAFEATPDARHPNARYAWDFGDGASAAGRSTSHAWGAPGTFAIRLLVTDGDRSAEALRTIEIAAPPPAEPASTPPADDTPEIETPPAPPGVRAIAPEGLVRSPATVTFETDPGAVVSWRINEAADWQTTIPALVHGDGEVVVQYFATGPGGASAIRALTLRLDAAPPALSAPTATRAEDGALAISTEVDDASAVTAFLVLEPLAGGESVQMPLARTAGGYQTGSPVPDGAYRVTLVARDEAGQETRVALANVGEEQESTQPGVPGAKPLPLPALPAMLVAALGAALVARRTR